MGVPTIQRMFATFCCLACSHIFARRVPPIYEDLPECPMCHAGSQIDSILRYRWPDE